MYTHVHRNLTACSNKCKKKIEQEEWAGASREGRLLLREALYGERTRDAAR